jgi:hypothetical protein
MKMHKLDEIAKKLIEESIVEFFNQHPEYLSKVNKTYEEIFQECYDNYLEDKDRIKDELTLKFHVPVLVESAIFGSVLGFGFIILIAHMFLRLMESKKITGPFIDVILKSLNFISKKIQSKTHHLDVLEFFLNNIDRNCLRYLKNVRISPGASEEQIAKQIVSTYRSGVVGSLTVLPKLADREGDFFKCTLQYLAVTIALNYKMYLECLIDKKEYDKATAIMKLRPESSVTADLVLRKEVHDISKSACFSLFDNFKKLYLGYLNILDSAKLSPSKKQEFVEILHKNIEKAVNEVKKKLDRRREDNRRR